MSNVSDRWLSDQFEAEAGSVEPPTNLQVETLRLARTVRARRRRLQVVMVAGFAAAVAAVIVVVTTSSLPSINPAPADPVPSPSVSARWAAPMPDGPLEPGTYVFQLDSSDGFNDLYEITMDVPDGYRADGGPVIFKGPGQGISTWRGRNVYADPCAWNGAQLDPPVGSSVPGLVAALVAQKGRDASTPTRVTLDGYAGMYLELGTPADLADCDRGQYRSWLGRWTEPGQRDMLWIINVDGTPLIIDAALGPKLARKDRAERIQIVESIRIEGL